MFEQKDTKPNIHTPIKETPRVDRLISNAHLAASKGDWDLARQHSIEATRLYPENADAWLTRARYAKTNDERIFALSQVHRLDPRHPSARQESYNTIWRMLEQDPYLAYLDETDDLYFVRSSAYTSLALPKGRGIPEMYPSKQQSRLAPAYRWLGLALVGMLFAGLGGLIFAPLAVLSVLSAEQHPLDQPDRIRSRVILLVSLILFVFSILLGMLLYTHIRG